MKPQKAEKAAPATTGSDLQKIEQLGGRLDFSNTAKHCSIQDYRRNYLLRRYRVTPTMAAAVAPFLFREART